jgi:hypothetical protein
LATASCVIAPTGTNFVAPPSSITLPNLVLLRPAYTQNTRKPCSSGQLVFGVTPFGRPLNQRFGV